MTDTVTAPELESRDVQEADRTCGLAARTVAGRSHQALAAEDPREGLRPRFFPQQPLRRCWNHSARLRPAPLALRRAAARSPDAAPLDSRAQALRGAGEGLLLLRTHAPPPAEGRGDEGIDGDHQDDAEPASGEPDVDAPGGERPGDGGTHRRDERLAPPAPGRDPDALRADAERDAEMDQRRHDVDPRQRHRS